MWSVDVHAYLTFRKRVTASTAGRDRYGADHINVIHSSRTRARFRWISMKSVEAKKKVCPTYAEILTSTFAWKGCLSMKASAVWHQCEGIWRGSLFRCGMKGFLDVRGSPKRTRRKGVHPSETNAISREQLREKVGWGWGWRGWDGGGGRWTGKRGKAYQDLLLLCGRSCCWLAVAALLVGSGAS